MLLSNFRSSRRKVRAHQKLARACGRALRVEIETLESRRLLTTYNVSAGDTATLISDVNAANAAGGSNTINLSVGTYTFTSVDNYWYGPNALPPITSNLTINGNGATLTRSTASNTPAFRLFYVSGGISGELPLGSLTLQNLSLTNGLAQGGGSNPGGGGLGAGGAVFNQGNLNLNDVTLTGNQALGGNGKSGGAGGGGMGQGAQGENGGGFGGSLGGSYGGTAGAGAESAQYRSDSFGGGGGGFSANGGSATSSATGPGGGLSGLGGGGGDGGTGGSTQGGINGAGGSGGAFGSGGKGTGGVAGGGGGVGGGGGGAGGVGGGGDGGFGGGGGFSGGSGGFGGGAGSSSPNNGAGQPGFGGGVSTEYGDGNGGAGLGGAIFSMYGSVNITNSTLTGNSAVGGAAYGGGGSGYGGAIFNLDGNLSLTFDTLANNTVTAGAGEDNPSYSKADGGSVYNLAYGNTPSGGAVSATATIVDSILADSTGGTSELVNNTDPTHASGTATVTLAGPNLITSQSNTGTGSVTGTAAITTDPGLVSVALTSNAGYPATLDLPGGSAAEYAGAAMPRIGYSDEIGTVRTTLPDLGAWQHPTSGQSQSITVTSTADSADAWSLTAAAVPSADLASVTLRDAINVANNAGGSTSINLANTTYTFNTADNYWYGPDALPAISSNITINGNGATLDRTLTGTATADGLRFFFVSGGLSELPAGDLTLQSVTLENGLAKGGDANGGGGGLGAGGAIFNQGTLTLSGVTLSGNEALGGGFGNGGNGGGGIGQDSEQAGGGFGGSLGGNYGGLGAAGTSSASGGGGGFSSDASGTTAGGQSGLGGGSGGGDGGNGLAVPSPDAGDPAYNGGNFGSGGGGGYGVAGGGGVGGGGGYGSDRSAPGGFGGGGAENSAGGFGGGGGAGHSAGGFAGADGSQYEGGGGGGLGGAIFSMYGTVQVTNSTLANNSAVGGSYVTNGFGGDGGDGYGGAIFNLDGSVQLTFDTIAANTVTAGSGSTANGLADGGALYNLAYGNNYATGAGVTASVTLDNSILSGSTNGSAAVNDIINQAFSGTNAANNGNTALINATGPNIVQNEAGSAQGGGNVSESVTGIPLTFTDPKLDSLGQYGGLTQTIPLQSGGPAISAGAAVNGITTDQIGNPRPATDPSIGAFQFVTVSATPNAPSFVPNGAVFSLTPSNPTDELGNALTSQDVGVTLSEVVNGTTIAIDDGVLGQQFSFVAPGSGSGTIDLQYAYSYDGSVTGGTIPIAYGTALTVTSAAQPASTTVGVPIADKATVSGGDSPTGTVTFNLYDNNSATGTPLYTDTEKLSNGSATSGNYIPTASGTDYWIVSYNGDSNNAAVSTNDEADPVTVLPGSLVVNTAGDPAVAVQNQNSLREAIAYAASLGGGTITFDPSLAGSTITLTGGKPLVIPKTTNTITIDASGVGGITINGNNGQVLIFSIVAGANVALDDLTLTKGTDAIDNYGTLALNSCTVSNNSADTDSGAINNVGTATITNSTLIDNFANGTVHSSGGAVTSSGTLLLENCTVTENQADISGGTASGGGIEISGGTAIIIDSTIAGNSANTQSTVFPNFTARGGGISVDGGTLSLINTIVAGNQATLGGRTVASVDVSGTVSGTNNLIGNGTGLSGITNGSNGNQIGTASAPINPLLAPLGSYGGPTQTLALLPGSPAISAGTPVDYPSTTTPITTDQTGYTRYTTAPSIGAYENEGFTIAATGGTTQSAQPSTAFGTPLGVKVTSNNTSLTNLAGGQVTLTAPSSGATASFTTNPLTLAPDGTASTTATATATPGQFSVTATASGITTPASFSLTITPPAGDYQVTSTADGTGSVDFNHAGTAGDPYLATTLRAAIDAADSAGGSSTISFASSVTGTITLTQGVLSVTNSIAINGPGANVLTIDGAGNTELFSVNDGTSTLQHVAITGLTLAHGSATPGGAIYNKENLSLANDILYDNSSIVGGAVFNASGATLTSSGDTFSDNNGGGNEGGAVNSGGTFDSTNDTFFGNSAADGGAIEAYGTTKLSDDTITGNTAVKVGTTDGYAGGLLASGSVMIVNTIIAGNIAQHGSPDVEGQLDSLGNNLIGDGTGASGFVASDQLGTAAKPMNPFLGTLGNYGGTTATIPLLPGSSAIGAGLALPAADAVQQFTQFGNHEHVTFTFAGYSTGSVAVAGAGFPSDNSSAIATALNALPSIGGVGGSVAVTYQGGAVYDITFEGALADAPQPLISFSSTTYATITTLTTGTAGVTTDQTGYTRSTTAPSIGAYEDEGFTIAATGGTTQSTPPSTAFGTSLGVKVTSNNPLLTNLAGGQITFTAPGTGASASFVANPIVLASDGTGSAAATANSSSGSYTVTATGKGVTNSASFSLTNTATPIITSAASPTAAYVGASISDTATVTGGNNPTGTVTFNLYNNSAGTGPALFTDTENLSGSALIGHGTSAVTQVGNKVTVYTISTLGIDVGDSVTIAGVGVAGYNGTFTVTGVSLNSFTYTDPVTGLPGSGEGTASFVASTVSSVGYTPSVAGTDYWVATYNGDTNNSPISTSDNADPVTITGSLVVTSTSDSPTAPGNTLRDAIAYAESIGGGTITFDPTVFKNPQTITLDGSRLALAATTNPIIIDGSGTGGVTISGDNKSSVFQVDRGATVTLNDLVITKGNNGGGFGGGINNQGTLVVDHSTISGNSSGDGGGIASGNYNLTILNSTITNNSATLMGGGGIYDTDTLATITIINSTIADNTAEDGAGGAQIGVGAALVITNSTFSGNTAPVAEDLESSDQTQSITNSIFSDGVAGHFSGSYNNLFGPESNTDSTLISGITSGVNGNVIVGSVAALGLGTIGNYGGPTQTIPLLPGSPAIDAGSNANAVDPTNNGAALTTDQRGNPRFVNTTVDIGAFESGGFTIRDGIGGAGGGFGTKVNSAFGTDVGFVVTAKVTGEPVQGGVITFTAPVTGASATFAQNPITIDSNGSAHTTATANSVDGSYYVTATASGITTPAQFPLTNYAADDTISGTDYLVSNTITAAGLTTSTTGVPIAGTTITLSGMDALGNPVSLTTTSNSAGQFTFSGLYPSDSNGYTLTETPPSADTHLGQTSTTAGATSNTPPGTPSVVSKIVLGFGAASTDNFFETASVSVSGADYLVPASTSAAGLTTTTTGTPIAGTMVTLTGTDAFGNPVSKTTTTSSNGTFSFPGLNPSNGTGYTLTEIPPAADTHVGQTSTTTGALTTPASTPVVSSLVLSTNGAASTDNFFDAVTAQPVGQFTGTPSANTTASYNNLGNTYLNVFDGNTSTFFDSPVANGNYVQLDLGAQKIISQIAFAPRAAFEGRLIGGIFEASNDPTFATGVVTLYTVTAFPQDGLTTVSVSPGGTYRYVRYVAPAGSYGNIAEFQVFGPGGTTTAPAPVYVKLTGTPLANTTASYDGLTSDNYTAAFDGNLNTFFDAPTANGNWVELNLGSPQQITQIAYSPRQYFESRMVGGYFEASNDPNFGSGVAVLYTINSAPQFGLSTQPVSGTYQYVRYVAPAGSYGNIAEFQVFGPATATPPAPVAPNAPGTPTLASSTSTTVTIGWTASTSTNVTGYIVLRNGNQIGTTSASMFTFSDTGLNPNTAYSYTVEAVAGGVDSAPTAPLAVTTPAAASSIVQLTGTASANTSTSYGNNPANTYAAAFDGNTNTFFDAPTANGNWVQLNFGAQETITKIAFAPRVGFEYRMLGGFFEASNDPTFATGAVTLYTITSTPGDGLQSVNVNPGGSYQYVRYVAPSGSYGNIAEFQVFGSGTTSAPTPPPSNPTPAQLTGVASANTASSYDGKASDNYTAAFDGNPNTFFDAPTANGNYVQLDLGSQKTITSISFAPRVGFEYRMVGGYFEASNDPSFSTVVTVLYTITSTPGDGLTSVNVNPGGKYEYIRYVSPAGSYGNIADIQVFGY
jgi:hypothetical protein